MGELRGLDGDWRRGREGVNSGGCFDRLLGEPMLSSLRAALLIASFAFASSAQAQFRPVEIPAAPMVPTIPAPMPTYPNLTTPNLTTPSLAAPNLAAPAPSLEPAAPALAAPAAPVESSPADQAQPAAPVATQEVPPPPAAEDDSSLEAKCLCRDDDTGEEKCEISCCDKPDHSICVEPK
jgi:hypothetical protein